MHDGLMLLHTSVSYTAPVTTVGLIPILNYRMEQAAVDLSIVCLAVFASDAAAQFDIQL